MGLDLGQKSLVLEQSRDERERNDMSRVEENSVSELITLEK